MGRMMKRFGPQAFFDNTLQDLVTVPAGHKYELVESALISLGAGGEVMAMYLRTPGPAYTYIDVIVGMAANQYLYRNNHEGVVANEGEGFSAAGFLVGGLWSVWFTYIDVDFAT